MRTPRYIANFDSTSAMLRALGRYLHGKDFPKLGITTASGTLTTMANRLPKRARETLYAWSGWIEAIRPEALGRIRAEQVSRWMVSQYPKRRYPAAMIGSSNGALVHLCAALGIPWLPQTFLIPVLRTGIHPDEPQQDMEWGRKVAGPLLSANPELQLHHMHDPNQDRLMIQYMTYFRVKRLLLGEMFEQFLKETLSDGATLFLVECQRTWPTKQVSERHLFQPGAMGGATPEEFLHGSPRVEAYLARYGSHRRRWDPAQPDGDRPEAEWGFEPALRHDVERFARQQGYRLRRMIFKEPEHLVPLVADLYRGWYRERRLLSNRSGRIIYLDGAVVGTANRIGPVLDEVQHGAFGGLAGALP